MLLLLASLSLSATNIQWLDHLPVGPSPFYVSNRAPLAQQPFINLPPGATRPEGWVKKQLELEANGFVGHLEQISSFLEKKNNAWLASDGQGDHGWEEVPYWLKGYGDLGYVLGDRKIIREAKFWIDGVLSSGRPDGWFGPESNRTANNGKPDVWPNMAMLFALQSYWDHSHDPRVITLMTNYFKYELAMPEKDMFLSYWEPKRGGDNMLSVLWLYNLTGQPWLLDLAKKIHIRTSDWVSGVPDWHGVNFAQGFREPAEYALLTRDKNQTEAPERDYDTFRDLYGQVPGGMYGADENARKGFSDPRQAAETCAMVEMMFSGEELLDLTGDARWAERVEDVAFNSLPASMTADEKALHYLTSPNLIQIDAKSKAPGLQNSGPMLLFDPNDHRCCQHNVAQGWPYYAEHLWSATPHKGLGVALYAPCTVTAQAGDGSGVTISENTSYPFSDTIQLVVKTAHPNRFPLTLRVPSWAVDPEVKVNREPFKAPRRTDYAVIDRLWKTGDVVTLHFWMRPRLHYWPKNHDAVSVERGPLTYSLEIKEDMSKAGGTPEWPAYQVLPGSAWNYGLVPDLSKFRISIRPLTPSEQPFSEKDAPVGIEAEGRKIDAWRSDRLGLVGLLQESPAFTSEKTESIKLVPMGAARLRISEFPTVTTDATAHRWVAPPQPKTPLPAGASHLFSGDTLDALSDGLVPKNSDDQSIPRFTWWDRKGSTEWVEYDLPTAREISGMDVYWFDDSPTGGGCRVPSSWRVLVFQGGQWEPVETSSTAGVERDRFNSVTFRRLVAKSIRIEATLQPGFSGGILEWQLRP